MKAQDRQTFVWNVVMQMPACKRDQISRASIPGSTRWYNGED